VPPREIVEDALLAMGTTHSVLSQDVVACVDVGVSAGDGCEE